jgi:DNA-binding NarL/FixJ family response regulator
MRAARCWGAAPPRRRLEISEKTGKAHLTSIFRTIGVTDRMQPGRWARRHGL